MNLNGPEEPETDREEERERERNGENRAGTSGEKERALQTKAVEEHARKKEQCNQGVAQREERGREKGGDGRDKEEEEIQGEGKA